MKADYYFRFTIKQKLHFRIILTAECNNQCLYCFREADAEINHRRFTASFLNELIRVSEKHGFPKIHFTGGEPLLVEDLSSFVKYIRDHSNLDVCITTNGTLLNEQQVNKLREAGLTRINVSIPTLNPAKYVSICGRAVLGQVLRGVDLLRECGYDQVKINIPLLKMNAEEIEDFLAYFLPRNAIKLRFFSVLPNRGLERAQFFGDEEAITLINTVIANMPILIKKEAEKRVFYRRRTQSSLSICKSCARRNECQEEAKAIRVFKDGTLSFCRLNRNYSIKVENHKQIENATTALLQYYQ